MGDAFAKVFALVTLHSKCARALTFENFGSVQLPRASVRVVVGPGRTRCLLLALAGILKRGHVVHMYCVRRVHAHRGSSTSVSALWLLNTSGHASTLSASSPAPLQLHASHEI